jgi:hypothetical protein
MISIVLSFRLLVVVEGVKAKQAGQRKWPGYGEREGGCQNQYLINPLPFPVEKASIQKANLRFIILYPFKGWSGGGGRGVVTYM